MPMSHAHINDSFSENGPAGTCDHMELLLDIKGILIKWILSCRINDYNGNRQRQEDKANRKQEENSGLNNVNFLFADKNGSDKNGFRTETVLVLHPFMHFYHFTGIYASCV